MSGYRRRLGLTALAVLAVLITAACGAWLTLRASLPTLSGAVVLPGLGAAMRLERDADGVPTLRARSRADLARGLGFLHGQERFFEMDLMRRAAAGELAALLGPALADVDATLRVHRFRSVARRALAALAPQDRALIDAYVAGVNAGLDALRSRPFEYWLLRTPPRPWTAEDTLLCVHAMFLQLEDPLGHAELQRGLLAATLPPALWRFVAAPAAEWDATIDGSIATPPPLPTPAEVDLRRRPELPALPPAQVVERLAEIGSNNWAVAGARTTNGAAVVANDMHLGYRVPIIWYRARLVMEGAQALDATGVTLPGAPLIVAGSNGSIAWGFTDSYGQFDQVIRLVPVDGDDDAYLTMHGTRKLEHVEEIIEIKGAPPRHLDVALTEWGPVVGRDWEGRRYALAWTAHDPGAANVALAALERTHSAAEALALAPTFGMPPQNLVVADRDGHIGWTIAGRLPARATGADDLPRLSTDVAPGFSGWLDPQAQPRLLDPPQGLLWSANARVVGGEFAALIGDDGMDRGARAAQIHTDLAAVSHPFAPADSLGIQLDDRALFLERWRALAVQVVERARAADPRAHAEAAAVLGGWTGHALPEDAAFRFVHAFRAAVEARVFYMLVAPARAADPQFSFEIPNAFEGPLWRTVSSRPQNLLAPAYADWDALLGAALGDAERLPPVCRTLATCTWGRVNAVHAAHPLSRALPFLAPWLDMPTVRVPGAHKDMPRIQGPDYGASERFSVAPGHESEGYFHMPGGQSGHPLSPFYRAGFDAWAEGRATPFLPGATRYTLTLAP